MLSNPHLRGSLYAFLGILTLSFDALLVRLTQAPSMTILFWRGLFIGISLTVFVLIQDRRSPLAIIRTQPRLYLTAGLLFALSGCGFVLSVQNTNVANTTVILSTAPFFSALFSFLLNRERVRPHTLIAMGVMVLGTGIIVAASIGTGRLFGDFMALYTAVLVGLGQAYLRRHQSLRRITIILINGYYIALFTLAFADLQPSAISLAVLALMGLLQMPLALVLFTTSTRYISAAEASMFMIVETVLGPFWVLIFLGEPVPLNTIYGGVLIIGALAVNTWLSSSGAKHRQMSPPPPAPP